MNKVTVLDREVENKVKNKVGDLYQYEDGEVYILASIGKRYCLISLYNGNYWRNPTESLNDAVETASFDGSFTLLKNKIVEIKV